MSITVITAFFHLQFRSKSVLGVGIVLTSSYACAGLTSLRSQHFDSEDDYCAGCRNVSHCQQQPYSGLCSHGGHPDDHAPLTYEMTPLSIIGDSLNVSSVQFLTTYEFHRSLISHSLCIWHNSHVKLLYFRFCLVVVSDVTIAGTNRVETHGGRGRRGSCSSNQWNG